ncbi:hypothetical protein GCM10029992_50490 [Glycomyces albus]
MVVQALHDPVFSNDGEATVAPLTTRSAPRAPPEEPLANRIRTVASPAASASTVNCTPVPVSLGPLQNPLPEYPAWLVSTVPSQTAGASSASYRTGSPVPPSSGRT